MLHKKPGHCSALQSDMKYIEKLLYQAVTICENKVYLEKCWPVATAYADAEGCIGQHP